MSHCDAKLPVTILIHTLNEEANLPSALASVLGRFDQIVLVDSGSTDRTLEIAKDNNLDTYVRPCNRSTLVEQRNWALENVKFRNEWVFVLDADERIPDDLYAEISEAINSDGVDGYWVRYKNIFFGRWVKRSSIYPNWNMRLFRHPRGRYERRSVNAHVMIDKSRVGYLKSHFIHEDKRGIVQHIRRLSDIAIKEAESMDEINSPNDGMIKGAVLSRSEVERRRAFKRIFNKIPFKPILMFVYLYLIRLGFLEGKPGLYHCLYRSMTYIVIDMVRYEKFNGTMAMGKL